MRHRRVRNSNITMLAVLAVFMVLAAVLFFSGRAAAEEKADHQLYRSITVEQGDTLWAYAEQYALCKDNAGCMDYVSQLQKLNRLTRDAVLLPGQNIVIIYYEG